MKNNKLNSLVKHYEHADRMMLYINYALVLYGFALASWYNTWAEAASIGLLSAMVLSGVYVAAKGTLMARSVMAIGFVVLTSLHIHQVKGAIEAHFGVFLLLAVLLYYRDWRPIAVYAVFTAIHHILFFTLQKQNANVYVIADNSASWLIIFWHAGYVVVEAAILILFSINLKRDALQSIEIMGLTEQMVSDDQIDLTLRSSGNSTLLQKFDGYTQEVFNLAEEVCHTSHVLMEGAQNLAGTTKIIKSSTQTQQVETDMVVTAVEEMSAAIQEVSRNASVAAESVQDVDSRSNQAMGSSTQTLSSMKDLETQIEQASETISNLNEQSRNIGSVLDVIRGIAEQTNLLALNAAIEAARAGEQGRGFAVVADEVRNLAQKTQQSTAEIDQMIETLQEGSNSAVQAIEASKQRVEGCVDSTQASQQFMEEISGNMEKLTQMNQMIATAANQQSNVVNEISKNLASIASVANVSAENAEQAAASSDAFIEASNQLSHLAARFKIA